MNFAERIEEYLAGTRFLRKAVAGMSGDQLRARPIPGKWSTLEVVCHLADTEIIYADRMKRILAEDRPTMFYADPEQFAAALACQERDIEEELGLIDFTRRHMARILRKVPAEGWKRLGMHSIAGPRTLEQVLNGAIEHIPHHLKFIEDKRRALGLPV